MRFFFLPNDVSIKFGSLYKIFTSRKKDFRQCLQYFAPLTFVDGFFQKKTRTLIGF
jgi:hypothetical protein